MNKVKTQKKYNPKFLIIDVGVPVAIVIAILLTVFWPKAPEQYRSTYIDAFDTATQFIGYAESEEEFRSQTDLLNEKLIEYHQLFTIYTNYDGINNLRTINLNAGKEPVKVNKIIIDLLEFSKEMYRTTNGTINIAMGSVLTIWHNYRTNSINFPEETALPPMSMLEEAAQHTDINKIIIDKEASTVFLEDPKMSLDVGGIGKGYAVQMLAEYAKELGMNNLIINVGGNVISIGPRADEDLWKLGIQNPDLESENSTVQTIQFSDKSVVTSGDYQRFYEVDGVRYCHIIDPDTLMPANYCRAVTVVASHSGLADALSTALFNMSYEEGLKLINSIEDAEAVWVFENNELKYSANFESYIVTQ